MNSDSLQLFSVVIHDVAPSNWPACQRVVEAVQRAGGVPMTLLVVPRYHNQPSDRQFERAMSRLLSQGHELALHGDIHLDAGQPDNWVDHVRRRWYTDGEGEFSALSQKEALEKLEFGADWFDRRGWPLEGFVAPAWLMSEGAWKAVRSLPFRYTATLRSVYSLPDAVKYKSPALAFSTRSTWRRRASVIRNQWVRSRWGAHPLVRLELHPHDADYPRIQQVWGEALQELLHVRTAATLASAVAQIRSARLAERDAQDEQDGQDPRGQDDLATVPHLHGIWCHSEVLPPGASRPR